MQNLNNFGILIGRASDDATVYKNNDGSAKIKVRVATKRNYTDGAGKNTDFIPVEKFIPADKADMLALYSSIKKGDMVEVSVALKQNDYTDAEGNKHFETIVVMDQFRFLEAKAARDARSAALETPAEEAGAEVEAAESEPTLFGEAEEPLYEDGSTSEEM